MSTKIKFKQIAFPSTDKSFVKGDGSIDFNNYLPLTGGTMSGDIDMEGKHIKNGVIDNIIPFYDGSKVKKTATLGEMMEYSSEIVYTNGLKGYFGKSDFIVNTKDAVYTYLKNNCASLITNILDKGDYIIEKQVSGEETWKDTTSSLRVSLGDKHRYTFWKDWQNNVNGLRNKTYPSKIQAVFINKTPNHDSNGVVKVSVEYLVNQGDNVVSEDCWITVYEKEFEKLNPMLIFLPNSEISVFTTIKSVKSLSNCSNIRVTIELSTKTINGTDATGYFMPTIDVFLDKRQNALDTSVCCNYDAIVKPTQSGEIQKTIKWILQYLIQGNNWLLNNSQIYYNTAYHAGNIFITTDIDKQVCNCVYFEIIQYGMYSDTPDVFVRGKFQMKPSTVRFISVDYYNGSFDNIYTFVYNNKLCLYVECSSMYKLYKIRVEHYTTSDVDKMNNYKNRVESVTNTAMPADEELEHKVLLSNIHRVYYLPSAGIPATDLTTAVQTSLNKADSALQGIDNGSITLEKLKVKSFKINGTEITLGDGLNNENNGNGVLLLGAVQDGLALCTVKIDGDVLRTIKPDGEVKSTLYFLSAPASAVATSGNYNDLSNKPNIQAPIGDLDTIRSNATNGNISYGWGNHANVGYAKQSEVTEEINHAYNTLFYKIPTELPPIDNSVTTAKIVDASISTNKIQDKAIIGSKIGYQEISTDHIANSSITNEKLANHSIMLNGTPIALGGIGQILGLVTANGSRCFLEIANNELILSKPTFAENGSIWNIEEIVRYPLLTELPTIPNPTANATEITDVNNWFDSNISNYIIPEKLMYGFLSGKNSMSQMLLQLNNASCTLTSYNLDFKREEIDMNSLISDLTTTGGYEVYVENDIDSITTSGICTLKFKIDDHQVIIECYRKFN